MKLKHILQIVQDLKQVNTHLIGFVSLKEIVAYYGESLGSVAYAGDDLPDIPCMEEIKREGGLVVCPSNAIPEIKAMSDFVASREALEDVWNGVYKLHLHVPVCGQDIGLGPGTFAADLIQHLRLCRTQERFAKGAKNKDYYVSKNSQFSTI